MPTKRKYYAVFGQTQSELAEKKRSPDEPLHIWSWNVAGLRACVKVPTSLSPSNNAQVMMPPFQKSGHEKIANSDAHVILLQGCLTGLE